MAVSNRIYSDLSLFSNLSTSTFQFEQTDTTYTSMNNFNKSEEKNSQQYGTFKWPSGVCYKGEYSNGKRNGHGVQTWPDNSVYDGEFYNDMRHGYGKHLWSSGEVIKII